MAAPSAREFEPGRISPGETIAAASGIALFVFLFFHWFTGLSAWSFFDVVDVLLAVIAVLAVAIAGSKAMGAQPLGANSGLLLAFIGTIASSITLTFALEGDQRKLGLWLSLFASLGILYGGWRAMHEEPGTPGPLARAGGRREPTDPTEVTTPIGTDPGAGKEGPGAPHPGTSTGAPGDRGGEPIPAAAGADPVPGATSGHTPPGIVGEPPAGEGTRPAGL